ncbi:DUF7115 domain-containing protein [Candidatus Halobonum tyrrellensis]|uniref:DUF7115 domain-containing protein n=1 Tax=Candidatus Halobonum tyrrellensis G22 TaxID=1324957 RepID=V4IZA4_9EURY|nr:hypothetical protein [Candidatus Halobonum tyrrellensis]ESP88447.1 hypothetical protein K933_08307 [Candidatus Halobonum tyrrellensis G22]
MSLPELVRGELSGEEPVARVGLGGDDELVVTPTRTLVYRADGLLSDETVEEYPHGAERVSVAESRRKAKLTLDYGLDGEETVAIPRDRLAEVLHPVLAGVLSTAGVTDPGETVERTFRFSELTLVVTSSRLVEHVGTAVWDEEFEEFAYDDVTDVRFEEGSVATSVVLSVDDRQERFKTPTAESRAVREAVTDAVCAYYDAASLEAFRALSADADGADERDGEGATVDFGDGPEPLSASPAAAADAADGAGERPRSDGSEPTATDADATPDGAEPGADAGTGPADGVARGGADGRGVGADARPTAGDGADAAAGGTDADGSTATDTAGAVDDGFAESGFETPAPADGTAAELAELRRAVDRQGERLDRQAELIERLVEELRRGR